MPVLNLAKGVKLGTTPVLAIYQGTTLIGRAITNQTTNPSFRTSITGTGISAFNSGNSTRSHDTVGYDGQGSFRYTHTAAAQTGLIITAPVTVQAGQVVTGLVRVKAPTGINVALSCRTSGGAGSGTVNQLGNGAWQEIRCSAAAVSVGSLVGVQVVTNAAISTTIYVDLMMCVVNGVAYTGNYRDGTFSGWVWNGTANASTSSGWA